jgi:hypothetical protein
MFPGNPVVVQGVWGLRECGLEESCGRVLETFRGLARITADWKEWYKGYDESVDGGRSPIMLSQNESLVREELLRGQIRDATGKIDEGLGYSLMSWAGPPGGNLSDWSVFRVTGCKRSVYAGRNVLSLILPTTGPSSEVLWEETVLCKAATELVRVWDPESIVVRNILTRIIEAPWPRCPVFGWINYLRPDIGIIKELPDGWRWFDEKGTRRIFIHSAGPPSPDRAEHVAAFSRLLDTVHWLAGEQAT